MTQIRVSDTLTVKVDAGSDPHVVIERIEGGCVRVEPTEIRHLVGALVEAVGILATWAVRK